MKQAVPRWAAGLPPKGERPPRRGVTSSPLVCLRGVPAASVSGFVVDTDAAGTPPHAPRHPSHFLTSMHDVKLGDAVSAALNSVSVAVPVRTWQCLSLRCPAPKTPPERDILVGWQTLALTVDHDAAFGFHASAFAVRQSCEALGQIGSLQLELRARGHLGVTCCSHA